MSPFVMRVDGAPIAVNSVKTRASRVGVAKKIEEFMRNLL
jgi:hypothetical protein